MTLLPPIPGLNHPPKLIVSLFDYSGVWSQPYKDAGYEVFQVDIQHGTDIYDLASDLGGPHGVLAAPPCTDFANCGARWFKEKDENGRTNISKAVVRRTLDLIDLWKPAWWALENPPGRIHRLVPDLGQPVYKYQPYEFGEPWSKLTWLWGRFNPPVKGPVVKPEGMRKGQPPAWYSKVGGKSLATKNYRSRTSEGFARAFFEANP